jgi:guanylate kinase
MADADELVEWAEVHGHSYGTPHAAIEGPVREGHHVVLDIDVQGARQMRDGVTEAVLIFVLPPNADVLVSRLSKRGTEADAELERRLGNAREELEAAAEFDYVVVNDDLSGAVATIQSIVTAENHRPARVRDLTAVVARLKSDIDARLSTRTNVTDHDTSTR